MVISGLSNIAASSSHLGDMIYLTNLLLQSFIGIATAAYLLDSLFPSKI